jgi:hypothetical protein
MPETPLQLRQSPQQYRQRMLGYIGGGDPLKLLAAAPKRLERLVKGFHAATLRKRPAPQKWSIVEIVLHLTDSELARSFRIRLILGTPGTPLQAFDQDAWVVALHYDKRSVQKALEEFRVLREANLALFRTLSPKQWKQEGFHAERGKETVESLVRLAAGHDINHIRQIEAILAAHRRSRV